MSTLRIREGSDRAVARGIVNSQDSRLQPASFLRRQHPSRLAIVSSKQAAASDSGTQLQLQSRVHTHVVRDPRPAPAPRASWSDGSAAQPQLQLGAKRDGLCSHASGGQCLAVLQPRTTYSIIQPTLPPTHCLSLNGASSPFWDPERVLEKGPHSGARPSCAGVAPVQRPVGNAQGDGGIAQASAPTHFRGR